MTQRQLPPGLELAGRFDLSVVALENSTVWLWPRRNRGMTISRQLIRTILDQYGLPIDGIHGPAHWARVLENGLRLSKKTRAHSDVVQLFAVFHDSKRTSEGADFEHGERGADYAASLRGSAFDLSKRKFDLLYKACAEHEFGCTEGDVTVRTCWDSDRLDLGRIGISPSPRQLCTDAAKAPKMLNWVQRRTATNHVPQFVAEAWGIQV